MKCIKNIAQSIIDIVCEECDKDRHQLLKGTSAECVEARGILIHILSRQLADCQICCVTGLSQQVVNSNKNKFRQKEDRWSVKVTLQEIDKRISADERTKLFSLTNKILIQNKA